MKTKHLTIFIMAMLMLVSVAARAHENTDDKSCAPQTERRFSPEQFRQKCDCFIINYAKLTPQEAQKFLPLYHAMKDEQRKLMREKGGMEREATKEENVNDKQSLKTLDRMIAIDRQVIDIEQDYQKKMLKVISASKLLKVRVAEKKFERQMLHKMAPHHKRGERPRK
ncbi:MAG: hypothetical protein J6W50_03205 [Bacteroidaceae bacterium]|nr:hypothetical protein [Bacteroidaceae bacterium]